jgi:hypothetical protein
MQEVKEKVEALFGIKLIQTFDSREDDGAEYDDLGHFTCYEPLIDFPDKDYSPIISIYEDGSVQFFRDATPYPVAANTEDEARLMMQALIEAPVPFDSLKEDDFQNFINDILDLL